MDLGAADKMAGATLIVILSCCQDEVAQLVEPHGVPNLEVAVGPFVREIRYDDLGILNELDDFTLQQPTFVVLVHPPSVQTASLDCRYDRAFADLVEVSIADLHDDECFSHVLALR